MGYPPTGEGSRETARPFPEKNGNFRLKWRVVMNSEWYLTKSDGTIALASPLQILEKATSDIFLR